jgi:hypothetical protein
VKPQGKSPPGSSKCKRDDNFKMDLETKGLKGVYCIALDQDREKKWVFVVVVVNIRVSIKCGEFLD